jgi:hypothetical protein
LVRLFFIPLRLVPPSVVPMGTEVSSGDLPHFFSLYYTGVSLLDCELLRAILWHSVHTEVTTG